MHRFTTTAITRRQGTDLPTVGAMAARLARLLMRTLWAARPRPGAVTTAHARRCMLDGLSPGILRDIGITREDAAGIASRQAELPFFMQSGFGRAED